MEENEKPQNEYPGLIQAPSMSAYAPNAPTNVERQIALMNLVEALEVGKLSQEEMVSAIKDFASYESVNGD